MLRAGMAAESRRGLRGVDGGGRTQADVAILDALTWLVALALALALARALRDFWRRRGFVAVAQDDRGMFSQALIGARDSWDGLLGRVAAAEADRWPPARGRNVSPTTGTTESSTSTNDGR